MQAAIGVAQLKKIPTFTERRRYNFKYLKEQLLALGAAEYFILPEPCAGADPSWFGFLLTCQTNTNREKIVTYIEEHGVQTRMLFAGNLIRHPCFDEMRKKHAGYRVSGTLKNTNRIMKDSFWVGLYPGMTDDKLDYMARVIATSAK